MAVKVKFSLSQQPSCYQNLQWSIFGMFSEIRPWETDKVKTSATPQGHTQMKVTNMAVSTVFITTKGGTEVAQDCFVLLGFGPTPSGLGHHSRDGVLLDGMRSEDPCKELQYRKINRAMAKPNHIGIFEFWVHVLDMQKIQIGLIRGSVWQSMNTSVDNLDMIKSRMSSRICWGLKRLKTKLSLTPPQRHLLLSDSSYICSILCPSTGSDHGHCTLSLHLSSWIPWIS